MSSSLMKLARLLLLCIFGLTALPGERVIAQSGESTWSAPELIASTEGKLASSSMVFLSDRYGQLHLLFPEQPDENTPLAFSYTAWEGMAWSEPIDVLFDANGGNLANPSGVIDAQDVFHIVWGGAGNTLRYASVPLNSISNSRSWTLPETLAASIGGGDIVADPEGTLYVTYVTSADTGSIALIRSGDGGATWSSPLKAAVSIPGSFPREVRLAQDGAARLHLAWTDVLLPDGWPPTGAYYTRSVDDGITWEEPQQIAGEGHGQLGVTTVGEDEVHLVWRSTIGGDGTFHQWSANGGQTWSAPDRHEDRGGFSGLPSFGLDSAGTLHMAIGPVFSATWANRQLTPWVGLAGERLYANSDQDPRWTEPERAVLAVRNGNEVHVVFETGICQLWHVRRSLGLPSLSTQAAPPPARTATITAQPIPDNPTADAPLPATATAASTSPILPDATEPNPTYALLIGPLSAALIVVSVVAVRLTRRRG